VVTRVSMKFSCVTMYMVDQQQQSSRTPRTKKLQKLEQIYIRRKKESSLFKYILKCV